MISQDIYSHSLYCLVCQYSWNCCTVCNVNIHSVFSTHFRFFSPCWNCRDAFWGHSVHLVCLHISPLCCSFSQQEVGKLLVGPHFSLHSAGPCHCSSWPSKQPRSTLRALTPSTDADLAVLLYGCGLIVENSDCTPKGNFPLPFVLKMRVCFCAFVCQIIMLIQPVPVLTFLGPCFSNLV